MLNKIYSHPVVIVCIPVFNEEAHIRDTLVSVKGQTYNDFLCVIRDNGSTDKTKYICENFAKNDERFVYLRSETNEGAAVNFQRLKDETNSKYLMWLGAHDKLHSNYLRLAIDRMENENGVVLCYSRVQWIDEADVDLRETNGGDFIIEESDPLFRYVKLATSISGECSAINGLIRREAIDINISLKRFAGLDHLLLAKLQFKGLFLRLEEALYFRRDFNTRKVNYIERITGGQDKSLSRRRNMFPLIRAHIGDFLTLPVSIKHKIKWLPFLFFGMLWNYSSELPLIGWTIANLVVVKKKFSDILFKS